MNAAPKQVLWIRLFRATDIDGTEFLQAVVVGEMTTSETRELSGFLRGEANVLALPERAEVGWL